MPEEHKDKMKNKYGIDLHAMLKNIATCRNGKQTSGEATTIYLGPEMYPPCYFGLGYVLVDPRGSLPTEGYIAYAQNLDDVPGWYVSNEDFWRPSRQD